MTEPAGELSRRLTARRAEAAELARRRERIAMARGVVALAGGGVLWLAAENPAVSVAWLALPGAAFFALVIVHARVIAAEARAVRAGDWYAHALARLDGTWPGRGSAGERFLDPAHPYARDLDLFGTGSLFQLLSTARTVTGEATLARWLAGPAGPEDIRARQQAAAELGPALDLREALTLAGDDVRADVDAAQVAAWGAAARPSSPWVRWVAALAGVTAASVVIGWASGALGGRALVAALSAESVLALTLRARVHRALEGIDVSARALGVLAAMLEVLERARFCAPHLVSLMHRLERNGPPASGQIVRLGRLVQLLDARRNQLFAPIGWVLLWTTQVALAIEAWRATCGGAIGEWITILGEVEALAALGAHAFAHPEDVVPVIDEGAAVLEGSDVAHPLLPIARAVRNDIGLGAPRQLLLVSGSNMSGKSTWLRAVGTNVVLALAGGTVRARAFRCSPLALGAAIHVEDSLLDGRSRFYAEILRLRAIVELSAGPRPVLFLLDEILSGTNSHDRRVGAEAIIRGLVGRGALGLVTTHDLALAAIADDLGAQGTNVHFADELVGDALTFDYRLRPGVVQRSNALALMRAVGLTV